MFKLWCCRSLSDSQWQKFPYDPIVSWALAAAKLLHVNCHSCCEPNELIKTCCRKYEFKEKLDG